MSAVLDLARKASVLEHLKGKSWGESAPASKPTLATVPPSEAETGAPLHAVKPLQADNSTPAEKPALLNYTHGVTLQNLLQQTIELKASDLHIHSGSKLLVRLGGKICNASSCALPAQECERLLTGIMSEAQHERLKDEFQVDFAYEIQGVGRFRANVYKQQRGYDAVFRAIKPTPPTLAELGLPDDFKRFTEFHQGLILLTGPAGCGKSSTMKAVRIIY
jgi:type II secretory ATPase GspE/PulE/Tfp pilus assembly ATPase PilB-like protein